MFPIPSTDTSPTVTGVALSWTAISWTAVSSYLTRPRRTRMHWYKRENDARSGPTASTTTKTTTQLQHGVGGYGGGGSGDGCGGGVVVVIKWQNKIVWKFWKTWLMNIIKDNQGGRWRLWPWWRDYRTGLSPTGSKSLKYHSSKYEEYVEESLTKMIIKNEISLSNNLDLPY